MKLQLTLFEILKEKLHDSKILTSQLEQLLKLENRSVRNRMRASTYLTAWEFYRIMLHYGISMDEMTSKLNDGDICLGRSMDLGQSRGLALQQPDMASLVRYIVSLHLEVERLVSQQKPWIRMACTEVPLFYLMRFNELTYFKIYMFYYYMVDNRMTFEAFLRKIKPYGLEKYFQAIFKAYEALDSVEIWDRHTFENLLRLMEECQVYGNFEQPETLATLFEQAEALVQLLKPGILDGKKQTGTTVEFYLFESVMREGFVLMGDGDHSAKMLSKSFMSLHVSSADPEKLSFLIKLYEAYLRRSNAMVKSSFRIKNVIVTLLQEQIARYKEKLLKISR